MTSEAPATALERAMKVIGPGGPHNPVIQAEHCVALIRDHGPALAAALRCQDALAELVAAIDELADKVSKAGNLRPTEQMSARSNLAWAAARAALSARVDDTPTRGTPTKGDE